MVASIVMWALGGLLGLAGLAMLLAGLRGDRSPGRRCRACGYSMEGVPGLRCPECGREARSEAELLKRARRWPRAALALAVVLVGAGLAVQGEARRRPNGWWSLSPRSVVVVGYWATGGDGAASELVARNGSPVPMRMPGGDAWPTWQSRLIASRALRQVYAIRRTPQQAGPLPNWGQHMTLLMLAVEDRDAARAVAIDNLRSPDRADWERGAFVAFWADGTDVTWPSDDRFLGALETVAGDDSSKHHADAYRMLARVDPLPTERLERTTRAGAGRPDRLGWHDRWSDDLTAVTFAARERAVPWLTTLLDDPDPIVRLEAADGLRRVGAPSAPALPRLRELLGDPDERVRENARLAIERIESLARDGGAGR